jgi:gliding motility-associated-like protein
VVIAPGNISGNILVTASNSSPSCKGEPAELEIELGERNVFIPNAFTPNGDGLNDTWVLRNIQYYPDNVLVILNRWGNEIYKVENYNNQWNGSSLNEGSYFYKLIINACGEKKELTGYVTIVR